MDPEHLPKFVYLHKNHKYRLKLGFYAAPSNPKTFSKAVRDELNKLKFTYCTELNGLVMGFGKISSNELIPADIRHCINVAINVDVYIFRPPVGSIIEAVVNQTSENHVSCLVHNLFNVSIVRPEDQPYNQWAGSKIIKDDEINVKVLSFDLSKKLPHITGEIVENNNERCYNSKDVQENDLEKYFSSTDESFRNLTKSVKCITEQVSVSPSKQLLSDSESSSETKPVRETRFKKYFDKSAKSSPQTTHTTVNCYSKLIKSPLSSSTPVSNSEHSIGSIDLIRTKQLKQLHKHLAKNINNKQKSVNLAKSNNNCMKDNISLSSEKLLNNDQIDNKCEFSGVSISNTDYSDDANNINSPCNIPSDSGISNDEHRQTPLQNYCLSKSKASSKSIKKLKSSEKIVSPILNSLSPNKVKSDTKLTNTSIFLSPNTDFSKKYEDNSVYTQNMITPGNKNSLYTQSIHNLGSSADNSDTYINNKCKSPNKLILSTRNVKTKNSPRKVELKISESDNKNGTVKLQSKSMFSMISDVDSSSDKSNELSVPHLNDGDDSNKETENITMVTLPTSKKNIVISQCTSSSDDEVYTKLKKNISKTESAEPCKEKIVSKNQLSVYSSGSESDLSSIHDTFNLKLIKSNTSLNKSVNMIVSDKHNLSNDNDNNVLPCKKSKGKRKQLNEKSALLQSPKCSNNENKLLPNLINNTSEMIKQISKNSSYNNLISMKSISNTSNSKEIIKPTINKELSNPFLKPCSTNSISSSSEDEVCIDSLALNRSLKESSTPLKTKYDQKNTLIQQLLTSIKYEDRKNEQKWTTQDIYSSSSGDDQFTVVKEFKKNKQIKKKKSKKDALKCIKNPIEKPSLSSIKNEEKWTTQDIYSSSFREDQFAVVKEFKNNEPIKKKKSNKDALNCFENLIENPNLSSINISQKKYPLQFQTKSSTDDSTEDEIDFIKKIVEKRKLNKNHQLESKLKNNNSENVSKPAKPIEQLSTTMKSQKSSATKTNELLNTKFKIKQHKGTKNVLLSTINDVKEQISGIVQDNDIPYNLNKPNKTLEKVHKKSKSLNLSLDKTNKLSHAFKTKDVRPTNSKDFILEKLLNSFDDSSSSIQNCNPDQSNVSSEPSKKKGQTTNTQNKSTVDESMNNTIKRKKKRSIETKDLLVDNIMNLLDFSSTEENYPTQLSTISEKKNEKSIPQKPLLTKTHELTNTNIVTKKNKYKKNKNLLLNHRISSIEDSPSAINNNNSTKLNTVTKTLKKNKKSKSPLASRIIMDHISSDTLKTKPKEIKDLFINSTGSNVDNSIKLNKLSKRLQKKIVSNTLKTKKDKSKVSKNLYLDNLIETIADSSSTIIHNKNKSTESEDFKVDFPDNYIPSKKKKKDHFIKTDQTYEKNLKIKDSVSLPEVCKKKKKKKEFNKPDINFSDVNDYKHKYTSSVELKKKESNYFTDKKEKNIKRKKKLPNDPVQCASQSKNTMKIMKTNDELIRKNPKKSIENKLSKNKLKDFISTQNDQFINDLDSLYHSFNNNIN